MTNVTDEKFKDRYLLRHGKKRKELTGVLRTTDFGINAIDKGIKTQANQEHHS